tara:strand:+ start:240 stop:380 length:141 start_codon:yes stop_codon:yes gene_type:complete
MFHTFTRPPPHDTHAVLVSLSLSFTGPTGHRDFLNSGVWLRCLALL